MLIQWELLIFSLLVALGMGSFAFVAVTEWKGKLESVRLPGAITSLAALGCGGIASYMHLGHPERIFHILGNVNSGIAQEFIVSAVTGAVVAIYIILLLWKGSSKKARKNVAAIGLVMAVIAPISTGKIYVLGARPAWDTWLLPVLFLATAAAMGMFVMYLWTAMKSKDEVILKKVNKVSLIAQGSFAVMVIAYVIYVAFAPFPDASRSVQRLLAGDLALIFWGFVVLIGLIAPIALTLWKSTAEKIGSALMVPVIGLACTVAGSVAIRALIYLMGSSVHQYIVG